MVDIKNIILPILTMVTIVMFACTFGDSFWTKVNLEIDGNYIYFYIIYFSASRKCQIDLLIYINFNLFFK